MPRRKLDFRTFDELLAELSALESRGYDRAGKWSLGQAAEHLDKMVVASLDGFGMKPPLLFRLMAPLAKKYIFTKRKMPSGVPVPSPFKPADAVSDDAGLAAYRRSLRRYQNHAGPLQASPVLGVLTRDEWDQLHLIHAAHHLSFLTPR
jgi:hypothetical protein